MTCRHLLADLSRLASGGRCPSCNAVLTPAQFVELHEDREAEVRAFVEWRLDVIEARLSRLEGLRADVERLVKDVADLKADVDRLGCPKIPPKKEEPDDHGGSDSGPPGG